MIKDEIKKQKEKVKEMPIQKRIAYFFQYNYIKIGIILACIIAVCIGVKGIRENQLEEYIYVVMVNNSIADDTNTKLMDEFATSRNVDVAATPCKLVTSLTMKENDGTNYSLSALQNISVFVEEGDYDIVICDDWIIANEIPWYINDFEEILPKDLYEKVKDDIYYYTGDDGTKVQAGFYARGSKKIMDCYKDTGIVPVIAINNIGDVEKAVDFVTYLYE